MKKNYFILKNNCFLLLLLTSVLSFGQVTKTFNTSETWVVPNGVTSISVQAWGGGGSSGNNDTDPGNNNPRGGGGGGAFTAATLPVTPGSTISITVGAGGVYSTGPADGKNSTIAVGVTTVTANGGKQGSHSKIGGAGGERITPNGVITASYKGGDGGNGGDGTILNSAGGGGGGGAAGSTALGGNGGNGTNAGTAGAAGIAGPSGGNGGKGAKGTPAGPSDYSTDGLVPGGGGGAKGDNSATDNSNLDRNGGNGRVILTWSCPVITPPKAGPDQSIVNATSFTLAANTASVGTGVWTIASEPNTASSQFSNTTSPNATFTPTAVGTYLLNWTISNGCNSSVDQVVVSNKCETNLIKNGDFSGGNTDWTWANGQGNDRVETNPENNYFANGSTSLTAELDKEASLRQVVTLIPGVSYTVSFRYARRADSETPLKTGVTVKITGGTSDITSTNFETTSATPKLATFTFTPTAASVGIEFYNILNGGKTFGTIIDDIVLLPTSQATPYAVTNPKGEFNTLKSCAGVAVQLDVENVPTSGVTYSWTGSAGAVFSATNIKNPTIAFAGSGLQYATVTVTTGAGCPTSSTTYVNVAAAPTITAPLASSICNGNPYSSGTITSTGTTFDWSRAAVAGINGGVAASGGTNIANATGFSETLTNSTNSPINVTYVLIPKPATNGCSGVPYNLVVTVNPKNTAPTGTPVQPTCLVSTGSIVLSGLPPTGTIVQKVRDATTNYTITGGGTQSIPKLNPGNYTFAVSNGSCSSTTLSITINNPPALVTWNGSWLPSTPTIENRVEFTKDYSSYANVEACSCYVKNNAVVTFNSGHTLKVVNEVVVNQEPESTAKLTFENNASLVQVNDLNTNSGVITYKRDTHVYRYDYTYWSSPVKGQTLKNLSFYTLFDRYFSYDPNKGWQVSMSGADKMDAGHGYIVRAPQPYPTAPNATDPTPKLFTGIFIGEPNNGIINGDDLKVVANKDYLLGNPYPSAIDADEFLKVNSKVLKGTLYFWTHNNAPVAATGTTTYKYTASDYASYNRTGGVGTTATTGGALKGGLKPNGKITAGQGFFAPAIADGKILFNNNMRIIGGTKGDNNSQFYKLSTSSKNTATSNETEKSRIWLNLSNKEGAFKQMLVGYIAGATNDYEDGFDGASYNGNQYLDFYSVNQDKNLTIQGRALPFVKKDSVALGYSTAIKGDFQITIDQTDGTLATQNIFLEDKDLKVLHDLKKEAYTFSTAIGTFNNRFVLRYTDKNAIEIIAPEAPEVLNKDVLVSVKDGAIKINSPLQSIDKIMIYDNLGRMIFQKDTISNSTFVIPRLISSHQMLVVSILLSDGTKVSRKIIY